MGLAVLMTLVTASYFRTTEDLIFLSSQRLDTYAAVDQVEVAYERFLMAVRSFDVANPDSGSELHLRYMILRSRQITVHTDTSMDRTFLEDALFQKAMKIVDEQVDGLQEVVGSTVSGAITARGALERATRARDAISTLDMEMYRIQINEYQSMKAAIEKRGKLFVLVSLVSWAAISGISVTAIWFWRKAVELSFRQRDIIYRKNVLLAALKHELSTPLQSIVGAAGVLANVAGTPESRIFVEQIESAARQVVVHMRDLADYSRLEVGGLAIRRIQFHPAQLLHDVVAENIESANEKGIRLEIAGCEKDWRVVGDYDRIRQILNNLVINGIKFTDEGAVSVVVDLLDGILRITVEDTGIGIPENAKSSIFEPFQRFDTSHKGMGLGLAISKGLANLLDGEISVSSTPGKGARFVVQIPVDIPTDPSGSIKNAL